MWMQSVRPRSSTTGEVRSGSIASVSRCSEQVRFTLNCGHAGRKGHFARFHTISSVRPANVRGFVNFISSAVMDVTIRR